MSNNFNLLLKMQIFYVILKLTKERENFMELDNEKMQAIARIYRYLHKNKVVHRNTLRKELTTSKTISKEKFSALLEGLIALGKVKLDGEIASLNSDILQTGLLQKDGNGYFVITPTSRKHLPVERNIATNYNVGDLLDVVVDFYNKKPIVTVLGKSTKEYELELSTKKQIVNVANSSQNKNQKFTKNNSIQTQTSSSAQKSTELLKQSPKPQATLEYDNYLLGRVVKISHDDLVFIPNKKSVIIRHIPILNDKEEYAKFQDKICVIKLVNENAPLLGGQIVSIKGDAGNAIHEYDAIAENYGAIMSWNSPELQSEIEKIPHTVDASKLDLITEAEAEISQKGKVVDLRHLPFATIDPATCKDMDDAIYSTIDENGDIVCYTAVANVTKYVDLNTNIGNKYIQGGFTIYAPNKAYNILPTELSTGICSLNPNEDRLAFVVKTTLDKSTGAVKSSAIYDSIIRSRQKYSYEQAQEIADNLQPIMTKNYLHSKIASGEAPSADEQILMNYYTAETIKVGFNQRQMIRFNSNKERNIVFDSDMQDIIDIKPIPHLMYHEVIESFMITANETTAKYADEHNLPNIYRVHDEPSPRKVGRANEFFDILGINISDDFSAQSTIDLLELVRGSANEEMVNNFLIKMQSRAVYSDHLYSDKKTDKLLDPTAKRISHYALQSEHYSHTTSPIRRVVDYVTQFNVLSSIHGTEPLSKEEVINIVEIANQRQLDIDQAEKDFNDISSVIYCEKHIGETLKGKITKFRYCAPDEGYGNDNIVVIVRNEEKGISAEIPLSQVVGNKAYDCELSEQACAVYDSHGNNILTICKPLNFVIEKADRKSMTIVGRANRAPANSAEKSNGSQYLGSNYAVGKNGYANRKHNRVKRFEQKYHHLMQDNEKKFEQ